jgi:aryl-alcohol dehydrogenase-like predicted oxidoreductase
MIAQTVLPRGRTVTTALGFGCAYLTGGLEARRSRRLVDMAFAAGFRHFDVAPLYGLGTAEDVLGAALLGRRGEVTIASKFGLPRPRLSVRTQVLRFVAAPARRLAAPLLRRREHLQAGTVPPRGDFSVATAMQSLEDSLRRLRTDYLDILLLHEATAADLSDELLRFLDAKRRDGVIRAVGVAAEYAATREIGSAFPGFFDVLQYPWCVLDRDRARVDGDAFEITYRSVMRAYAPLRAWLAGEPAALRRLSDSCGVDLSRGANLSNVLIAAALARVSGGIVLVGTRRPDRIGQNAAALQDETLRRAGCALLSALDGEADLPFPR